MEQKEITGGRPPIVVVVGHIDHGKSTLLDYIRHTQVAAGEAGGITQHLSAYEAVHKNATGQEHTITFLDTPGHEAFTAMRGRGLKVADVAILVVSAEDGVKPQTLEALKLIEETKTPYIVALTKIDKPSANVEKAKLSLLEHQIFLEGLGGTIPFVAVSGKTGEGVAELLDLIVLAAQMEGLSSNPDAPAEGLVIEAHVDNKRGNTATLIVKDGSLYSGEYVVAGAAFAPVRIMENFLGKPIKEALAGSPVRIVGFSSLPEVGAPWKAVESKKEAERDAAEFRVKKNVTPFKEKKEGEEEEKITILPLIIKTDFAGTGEAVMHELKKLPQDPRLEVRVVSQGLGPISEGDVKLAIGATPGIVVGFNVKVERQAQDLAERQGVLVATFDIIYKLAEWLAAEVEKRRPRERIEERRGTARVIKFFSSAKGRVIVGGKVEEGALLVGAELKILRRDLEIGRGSIVSLQAHKRDVKQVEAGSEFGTQIKTAALPAHGDTLEAFEVVYK